MIFFLIFCLVFDCIFLEKGSIFNNVSNAVVKYHWQRKFFKISTFLAVYPFIINSACCVEQQIRIRAIQRFECTFCICWESHHHGTMIIKLLYNNWTLEKHQGKKKPAGKYTGMLSDVLNKSLMQQPTKHLLYGLLSQNSHVRQEKQVGLC